MARAVTVQGGDALREYVELSLPAQPDMLFMVRFHVAAAASHLDLGVDDIDDLRLAADELCLSLLSRPGPPDRRLRVWFAWDENSVEVVCKLPGSPVAAVSEVDGNGKHMPELLPADISGHVLDALVDAHGLFYEEGHAVAWLSKQRVGSGQLT